MKFCENVVPLKNCTDVTSHILAERFMCLRACACVCVRVCVCVCVCVANHMIFGVTIITFRFYYALCFFSFFFYRCITQKR